MKTVLIGAVESTEVALRGLCEAGAKPELLITLPLEAKARHSNFNDLSSLAKSFDVPVFHSKNINNDETMAKLRDISPDYILVIGWSQICRAPFLAVPKRGAIGFHPSALPRLRGRAVIPWTILLNERITATSLFWIHEGTDTGDLILQHSFPVAENESAKSLIAKHKANLKTMIPDLLRELRGDHPARIKQDHSLATYCAKRGPEDGRIDWNQPAEDILRFIRAVGGPYPGAFTVTNGQKLNIDAACRFADGWRYFGITGQIQFIDNERFIVRCGDGECIEVTDWRMEDDKSFRPRIHQKFG